MEKLRSWIYGPRQTKDSDIKNDQVETRTDTEQTHNSSMEGSQASSETAASTPEVVIDPKVAEYFQIFPEPYREKAIQRYSKRDGIYRWDFIRDQAMQEEMRCAMRGMFLEDQREFEKLHREKQDMDFEKEQTEQKLLFHERKIPPWEQKLLEVIPLQPGDTMAYKLFQTVNLAALGMAFIWSGVSYKKRNPFPRWKVFSTMMGAVGTCGCCQVASVYRLMDWGPYDRSEDDRNVLPKARDELKETFRIIKAFLNDKFSGP